MNTVEYNSAAAVTASLGEDLPVGAIFESNSGGPVMVMPGNKGVFLRNGVFNCIGSWIVNRVVQPGESITITAGDVE